MKLLPLLLLLGCCRAPAAPEPVSLEPGDRCESRLVHPTQPDSPDWFERRRGQHEAFHQECPR